VEDLPYVLPDYVSPSSLATYSQCPLKYKYSRVNKIQEPPTQATLLGNFVHDVLEAFYGSLKPQDRTVSSLRSLSTTVWADGDWANRISGIVHHSETKNFRWNAWWCLENVFKVENPVGVAVSGVETEINGKIGDATLKGYVDRWVLENEKIRISDYKTGKTPKEYYVGDKFVQLLIYAIVLAEQEKSEVESVELLYLKDGKKFVKSVDSAAIGSVSEMVVKTYSEILSSFESDDWPAKPSKLCYWCFYKDTICEYWKGKQQ